MFTLAVTVLSGAAAFSEARHRALKHAPTKTHQWPHEALSMVKELNRRYNAEAALGRGVFFHTFMGSRHLQVVSK